MTERSKSANPSPEEIKSARLAAGLTQTQAARLVHGTCRMWQYWEAGERRMHPAIWELFNTKVRETECNEENRNEHVT